MPPLLIQLIGSGLIALALAALGAYYLVRETRQWRGQAGYRALPPADSEHFRRQYFRRVQGSVLLIVAGAAVFIGLNLIDPTPAGTPRLYVGFWVGVLIVLLWMIALAGIDLWAIRRYAGRHARRLHTERRLLIERQLEQYRSRGNGHLDDRTEERPEETV